MRSEQKVLVQLKNTRVRACEFNLNKKIVYFILSTWKDLSTPNTLSVKALGTTVTGDFSFSHRLPGDHISWLRFLMHKFNGDSQTSSETSAIGFRNVFFTHTQISNLLTFNGYKSYDWLRFGAPRRARTKFNFFRADVRAKKSCQNEENQSPRSSVD